MDYLLKDCVEQCSVCVSCYVLLAILATYVEEFDLLCCFSDSATLILSDDMLPNYSHAVSSSEFCICETS